MSSSALANIRRTQSACVAATHASGSEAEGATSAEREARRPRGQLRRPRAMGAEHILLVEDQDAVRQVISRVLISAGYRVTGMGSPVAALAYGEREPGPLHLLVTDVVMPGMTGYELARALTASRPSLPVLFLSGYPQSAIAELGDLPNDREFLQKPFRADVLLRKIREVLDRGGRVP